MVQAGSRGTLDTFRAFAPKTVEVVETGCQGRWVISLEASPLMTSLLKELLWCNGKTPDMAQSLHRSSRGNQCSYGPWKVPTKVCVCVIYACFAG